MLHASMNTFLVHALCGSCCFRIIMDDNKITCEHVKSHFTGLQGAEVVSAYMETVSWFNMFLASGAHQASNIHRWFEIRFQGWSHALCTTSIGKLRILEGWSMDLGQFNEGFKTTQIPSAHELQNSNQLGQTKENATNYAIELHTLVLGSLLLIKSALVKWVWFHELSSSKFQYNIPGSPRSFETASHRKHTCVEFQEHLNFQRSLWNSQSPRISPTWNVYCIVVIDMPARRFSAWDNSRPPGRLSGLIPVCKQFRDHTTHLNTWLTVLFSSKTRPSHDQIKNREYLTLFGRKTGMFNQRQNTFSVLILVTSCAPSPYSPNGTFCRAGDPGPQ